MKIDLQLLSEQHILPLIDLLSDRELYTYIETKVPPRHILIKQVQNWVQRNLIIIDNEMWINWVACNWKGEIYGHAQATIYLDNSGIKDCWLGWTVVKIKQCQGIGTQIN